MIEIAQAKPISPGVAAIEGAAGFLIAKSTSESKGLDEALAALDLRNRQATYLTPATLKLILAGEDDLIAQLKADGHQKVKQNQRMEVFRGLIHTYNERHGAYEN